MVSQGGLCRQLVKRVKPVRQNKLMKRVKLGNEGVAPSVAPQGRQSFGQRGRCPSRFHSLLPTQGGTSFFIPSEGWQRPLVPQGHLAA